MIENDPLQELYTFYEQNSGVKVPPKNINIRHCLYCNAPLIGQKNPSPYCSSRCMELKDKGIKFDGKGSEKNVFLKFGEIIRQ